MAGILRIAFAALFVGAVTIAPASAGVPVFPVSLPDSPAASDESAADPFDRSPRSAVKRAPLPCGRFPRPTGSAPLAPHAGRPPSGPFDLSVPPHVRFCVWRE